MKLSKVLSLLVVVAIVGNRQVFMKQSPSQILSEHEKRVVELIYKGLTNKEIAHLLGITPRTVEYHIGKIFKKLEVTNRTAAAIVAKKMGLL